MKPTTDDHIIADLMRDFINRSEIFNNAKIAKEIGVKRQNFNSWLKMRIPLNVDQITALETLLKKYGFMQAI